MLGTPDQGDTYQDLEYVVMRGDTLDSIVRRHYRVGGVYRNNPQQELLLLNQARSYVQQRNPTIPNWLALQPGTQLMLPDVPGVVEREDVWRRGVRWHSSFLSLWLVCLALGFALSLWAPSLTGWLNGRGISATLTAPFSSFFSSPLRWSIPLTLVILVLWLAGLPLAGPTYQRTRTRYVIGSVLGFLVLLGLARAIAGVLLPPAIVDQLSTTLTALPLLALWATIVFLGYLYFGDGSPQHRDYLVPYRLVWTVLSIVLLAMALSGYLTYESIQERVNGLLAVRSAASKTVTELQNAAFQTADAAEALRLCIDATAPATTTLCSSFSSPQLRTATIGGADTQLDRLEFIATETRAIAFATDTYATQARREIEQVVATAQREQQGTDETGLSLGQTLQVLSDTIQPANQLTPLSDAVIREIAALRVRSPEEPALSSGQVSQLKNSVTTLAVRANTVSNDAQTVYRAFNGVRVSGLPTYLWIGTLYAVFVLFPWVLFLLFLYRKRTSRAGQILEDLLQLDPTKALLKKVFGFPADAQPSRLQPKGSTDRSQGEQYGLLESITNLPTAEPSQAGLERGGRLTPARRDLLLQRYLTGKSGDNLAGGQAGAGSGTGSNEDVERVVGALARQAFSPFEYVLSLVFLTCLTAIGWYYVFYPRASLGVATLIQAGSGIRELTAYITSNLTPLTLGFAGAYFFVMQMLVRRYLADDLYPSAFLQASQRLLLLFVLGLLFTILGPLLDLAPTTGTIANTNLPVATPAAVSTAVPPDATASLPLTGTEVPFTRTLTPPSVPETSPQQETRTLGERLANTALRLLPLIDNVPYLLMTLVAFFAGIFPGWAVNYVSTTVNRWLRSDLPQYVEDQPLTRLQGVNIWTEARLAEENVENVQSMATIAIEQLVIGTRYPTAQIVDWIDQSILYLHAGDNGEWMPYFRRGGIRTATDLLDRVGVNILQPDTLIGVEYEPLYITELTQGLNDAVKSIAPQPNNGSVTTTAPIFTEQMVYQICDALWPDQNLHYVLNYYSQVADGLLARQRPPQSGSNGLGLPPISNIHHPPTPSATIGR